MFPFSWHFSAIQVFKSEKVSSVGFLVPHFSSPPQAIPIDKQTVFALNAAALI